MAKPKQTTPHVQVGILVPVATRDWLTNIGLFQTPSTGARLIVMATPLLYTRTIKELKGRFLRDELLAIVKLCENAVFPNHVPGDELISHINIAIPTGQGRVLGVAAGPVLSKLQRLTSYQAAVLQWWLCSYQYKVICQEPPEALEDLLDILLEEEGGDDI